MAARWVAIVERAGRVLAVRPAGCATWEFPGMGEDPCAESEEALRRCVGAALGVRLSPIWYFDTLPCAAGAEEPDAVACYVCGLLPADQPCGRAGEELRWLSRDELLALSWHPASLAAARSLGAFWDQAFAATHL